MSSQSIRLSAGIQQLDLFQTLETEKSLSKWTKNFNRMEPAQLHQILQQTADALASTKHPIQAMNRLAEVLPKEKLQASAHIASPEIEAIDALTEAKQMLEQAQYGLEKMEGNFEPSVRSKLSKIFDEAITILESILGAFGIAEFFKPAENSFHADMKTQKIMALLTLFSLVCAILIPIVGPMLASAIVGGTLLTIAALSLIYPKFKPAPSQLPCGQNLTKQYREGLLISPEGRKDKLDQMYQTLAARGDEVKHAMLIGQSGVGKTELVKSFVRAIERGDYPELKGKQVIYFNMADLVNFTELFGGSGNRVLAMISEAMGRHRDDFILVFDEVQTAFQDKYQSPICEQLKTMLDRGPNKFPYAIAITTEEEYYRDIYLNHPAFARRFNEIRLENTSPEETVEILDSALLRQAPHLQIDLENNSLAPLLQKTTEAFPEAPMPGKAVEILSKCIHRTRETQKSEQEQTVERLKREIRTLSTRGVHAHGKDLNASVSRELSEQISDLRTQLAEAEGIFTKEKADLDLFFQTRAHLSTVKRAMFHAAIKTARQGKVLQRDQNAFLLYRHYLSPAIDQWVKTHTPNGVKNTIDAALIDAVIEEESASAEKVREAVERARKQIEERRRAQVQSALLAQ